MSKICVSIGEPTYADTLNVLHPFDFAEIRLDQSNMTDDEILRIFALPKTLVATCRVGHYDDAQRLHCLRQAIEAGARYVDVETEASPLFQREVRACAMEHACKVIVSYHNFISTPPTVFLEEVVHRCQSQGADLVKLVTTAHYESECSRVLALYRHHKNLLAFAMGHTGRITRVACLYLGAPFTYAAVSSEKSVAAGQLSFRALSEIMDLIKEQ